MRWFHRTIQQIRHFRPRSLSSKLTKLRDIRDVQGSVGNYDQGEYMRGLYNGLELAVSIMEDRNPEYVDEDGGVPWSWMV